MAETVQIVIEGVDRASAPFKGVTNALGGVEKAAAKSGAALKAFGESADRIGNKLMMGVSIPLIAMGGVAVQAASKTAESMSKMNVVFGQSSAQVKAFADSAATNLGLSRQAAMEASATFGNLFLSIGMGQKPAADMSTNLVQLAADLASFNNINTDEALLKLRSGLLGEAEPMRALGVMLTEATVQARAMSMGLVDASGEVSEAAKVQARYAIILEQTRTAQGDFARTSDGMANSTRIAKAELDNAAATLGQNLIPAATIAVTEIGKLAEAFGSLSGPTQTLIVNLGLVAIAAGPVLKVFGALAKAAGVLVPLLGGALPAALATLATAGFGAAYGGAMLLWEKVLPGSPAAKFMEWVRGAGKVLPEATASANDLIDSMDAAYVSSRSAARGLAEMAMTAKIAFTGAGDTMGDWEQSQLQFWNRANGAALAQDYTSGVFAENEKTALATSKAWMAAYDDVAEGIKNSIGSALNDAQSKLEGLLKGTQLEKTGNEPGANGAFENIFRAADVAVKGGESPWAKQLGLTQDQAKKIVNDFRNGIMNQEVKALINVQMLVDQAKMAQQAKILTDAFAVEIATAAKVNPIAVEALLGLTPGSAQLAGAKIGSDVAAGFTASSTGWAAAGVAQGEQYIGGMRTALEAQSPSMAMMRLGQDAALGFNLGFDSFWPPFTEAWQAFWTARQADFALFVEGIKGEVNKAIGFINSLITGWNDLELVLGAFDTVIPLLGRVTFEGLKVETPNMPPIPLLAQGGTVMRAGSVLVGERGPEMLSLQRGAQVTPLSGGMIDYDRLAAVLSAQPIMVQIDGERVATVVRARLQLRGAGGLGY